LKADPDLPTWVMVDDKRLRQVLLNLLGNAVKFTPSGHVCLSVSPTKASDSNGPLGPDHCSLRFEVLDSGPGISDQDQARIFEPFEQAGDAHSQAQGTGLGLAIAQQLTRLMGGEIQLSSQAGQGSLFWFDLSLPICLEQAEAAASSRLAPVIQGYEGPRRCVLVVDDAAIHRQMLVDMLEPLGFQTRQAADGIEALEQVMARRPDLILMDQDMPLLDGLQATQQLRHLPLFQNANKPLPIVILSDQACGTAEPSALGSGADAYLAKPVHRQALLDVMGRCLGLRWV
jgi:CheY-like chemotaxis protein